MTVSLIDITRKQYDTCHEDNTSGTGKLAWWL